MTSKNFTQFLKTLGSNRSKFSQFVNISYSTVSKYGKQNPVPEWVRPMLMLISENKELKSKIVELENKGN